MLGREVTAYPYLMQNDTIHFEPSAIMLNYIIDLCLSPTNIAIFKAYRFYLSYLLLDP